MLELYQPPRPKAWGILPNMSPFCVKLETYLRMAKIPHEVKSGNPRKAPKGKIPYIIDDGKMTGDAGLIIDSLKTKYGDPLDQNLSAKERAILLATRRMMEEHTYFAVLYLRWSTPNSFEYVKNFFMPFLPPIIGGPIMCKIRSSLLASTRAQGMGRHTREEIIGLAKADIDAYSALLGDNLFFLGDSPTSLDATMFGFLINAMWVPWDCELKSYALGKQNLVDYVERMKTTYWKDL